MLLFVNKWMTLFISSFNTMYKLKYHPTLAARWNDFGRSEQVIMIGNELNRALNMLKDKDFTNAKEALARALELLDLLIEFSDGNRRWELLRLRGVMAEFYSEIESVSNAALKQLCKVLLSFDGKAFDMLHKEYS
jgi:hypothetical protein